MEGDFLVSIFAINRAKDVVGGQPLKHLHDIREGIAVIITKSIEFSIVNYLAWLWLFTASILLPPYN